jgi:hypothetical protein
MLLLGQGVLNSKSILVVPANLFGMEQMIIFDVNHEEEGFEAVEGLFIHLWIFKVKYSFLKEFEDVFFAVFNLTVGFDNS